MAKEPFVVTPETYPRALNVVGEKIVVLASGKRTGSYEVFLQSGVAGTGPPPHHHPWDESFVVTGGEIEFGIGKDSYVAKKGTLVHVPAGAVHWFRFGEGGGEMVSMTSELGASEMFTEFDARIPAGAPDVDKLKEIGSRHRATIDV